MRIALVSTSAVAVPPKAYGGTEAVVAALARGLTRRGHAVTVFATGDSLPESALRSIHARPVWPPSEEAEREHVTFSWQCIERDADFDVVHLHNGAALAAAPTMDRTGPAIVYTMHDERREDLVALYRRYDRFVSFVAISHRQAELLPDLRVRAVIRHGIDPSAFAMGTGRGGYCAFLGRFAREKGAHVAIDAAVRACVPLRIGAPAPNAHIAAHCEYFDVEIRPRLARHRACVWLGELDHEAKVDLVANACALLFPIDWEEPFGLVMIESMMCGTPVIAFGRGSVPEVVIPGATGHIVSTSNDLAQTLRTIHRCDRTQCRERAIEKFNDGRMVDAYERLYAHVAAEQRST